MRPSAQNVLSQSFQLKNCQVSQKIVKITLNFILVLNVTDTETWNECQFVDPADDCTFYFLYYYDGADNLTVWVKEEKDCPG